MLPRLGEEMDRRMSLQEALIVVGNIQHMLCSESLIS